MRALLKYVVLLFGLTCIGISLLHIAIGGSVPVRGVRTT